jgi:hypothetical protein
MGGTQKKGTRRDRSAWNRQVAPGRGPDFDGTIAERVQAEGVVPANQSKNVS